MKNENQRCWQGPPERHAVLKAENKKRYPEYKQAREKMIEPLTATTGGNRTDGALHELVRSTWQTVSRPSHCGVRFAQVEERTTPHTRVTQQAEW